MKDIITILWILKKKPHKPHKAQGFTICKSRYQLGNIYLNTEYILNTIHLIDIQGSVVLQKKNRCVALLETMKDNLGKCRSTARKAECYISK